MKKILNIFFALVLILAVITIQVPTASADIKLSPDTTTSTKSKLTPEQKKAARLKTKTKPNQGTTGTTGTAAEKKAQDALDKELEKQNGKDNTPPKTAPQCGTGGAHPCNNFKQVYNSIAEISTDLVIIAGASILLLYAWAALLFITAGSNPRRVEKAKDQAKRVTIALFVIAGLFLIQTVIVSIATGGILN